VTRRTAIHARARWPVWIASVLLAACGPIAPTTSTTTPDGSPLTAKGPLMAEFDRHLAIWQAAGITRYAFRYTASCFCPSTASFVVRDGAEIRIDGVAVDGAAPPAGAPVGVEGLFDIVRRAVQGDRATIGYDETTGVPMGMESDPIANAIDDELSFQVTDWTLDPPDDRLLGDITRANRLWDSLGTFDYDWSIQDGGTRYDIEVRNGTPTVQRGGKAIDASNVSTPTVPALFDALIYAATTPSIHVAAEFDPTLGVPTRFTWSDSRPDANPSGETSVLSFRRR
jgi:hypothetical protein